MNLQSLYSLALGQKITKPYITEKYFPLPFSNYITFQPFSRPIKNYDYYNEVLSLINPILEKNNIKIVQVGGPNEKQFPFCYPTQGNTNWGQLAFLIKNSKLHFGSDSIGQHLASFYDIPLVDLICNNYKTSVQPFFGTKNKQIIFEPIRPEGHKPVFALDGENPKSINTICPIKIAHSICELLNLEFIYPYESIYIGQNYQNKIIESAPDFVINISNLEIQNLVVRMDIIFNEQNLFGQLQHCKCIILTDRPINSQLLIGTRQNIMEIIYILKKDPAPDFNFCKLLSNLRIPYKLLSYENDEFLNPLKLDFLDFPIIIKKSSEIPKEINIEKIKEGKIFIKSNKFLLARSKIYSCCQTYLNNQPLSSINPTLELLSEQNLDKIGIESDFLYFLEKF